MILFDDIVIEGFGNIAKPLTFNLNRPGLNILNSPNGKGKTTIFSAMCWVLFGKTLKKKNQVETWEDKRPKGYQGTKVTINLLLPDNNTLTIHRCLKYKGKILGASGSSRLIIIYNDSEKDFKDKNEAQKWINKTLGMGFSLFKNTVVFGQKMERFIEEDGPTKKAVFEEMFETQFLQEAKDIAIGVKQDIEESVINLENKISVKTEKIKGLIRLKNSIKSWMDNFEENKSKRIREEKINLKKAKLSIFKLGGLNPKSHKDRIAKIEKKIAKEKDYLKAIADISNMHFKYDMELMQLNAEIDGCTRRISSSTKQLAEKHFKCSLCKQKLDKDAAQKHVKQIKANIEEDKKKRVNLNLTKKDLEIKLADAKHKSDLCKGIEAKLVTLRYKVDSLKSKDIKVLENQKLVEKIKSNIEKIRLESVDSKQLDDVINKIKATREKINNLEKLLANSQKELEGYEWLIKEPLSNSGIKSFIFSEMVKRVNQHLSNYAHIIGGNIVFGLDLDSGNKDFYITIEQDGHVRFYQDLSGGQQQLINICIAFAMYDTQYENNAFNLLVLDEVFEFLDDDNVEIVGDLIKQKSKGKSLFVVTHKRSFIPNGSNLITL